MEETSRKLWYDEPSKEWAEALPIGNGRIGGMVFGTIQREKIQLNEDSIWYGGPIGTDNVDGTHYIQEIRELLQSGKQKEAEHLSRMALMSSPKYLHPYQPLGDWLLWFYDHDGQYELYSRTLDLDSAIARTSYKMDGVRYERECFVSSVDQVIVMHLTCDQPGMLTFSTNLMRRPFDLGTRMHGQDTLVMYGECGKYGVEFAAGLKAIIEGGDGKVRMIGDALSIEGATSVTLLLSAQSTFRYDQPESICLTQLNDAAQSNYVQLKERHIDEYQEKYKRVRLRLDGNIPPQRPTNERLAAVMNGDQDDDLLALLFDYGRYLLLSSSRPGSIAANLQGIWNDRFTPPWESKYTININTQMNYWPAEVCNLAECHEPLFDLIERMLPNGQETARTVYKCGGFVAHHNTNMWGNTHIEGTLMNSPIWPMGGAWLSLHLWEHYCFGGSLSFLKDRAYPIMKESAQFLLEYMVLNDQGELITGPSLSPENSFINENGVKGVLCMGPSMDLQIATTLFQACMEASELLAIDKSWRNSLRESLQLIPQPSIGKHGQIMEWMTDYDEAEPGHRHFSQLFGLFPGELIDGIQTPELAIAAEHSIERRLQHGGGDRNWSKAWVVHFYARLGNGDQALKHLRLFLTQSVQSNLLSTYPPFQIDGNFGVTSGIAEMLVQSHHDELRLLPALPESWSSGEVSGLRCRGGYEVVIEWENRKMKKTSLQCNHNRVCRVRTKVAFRVWNGHTSVNIQFHHDIMEFQMESGVNYTLEPIQG